MSDALLASSVLLPALVMSAAIMLIAWPPWRRDRGVWGGYWGGPVAIGLGFCVGFLMINQGFPTMPPAQRWQWLLPIALAATLLGTAATSIKQTSRLTKWIMACTAAASVGFLLHPPPAFESVLPWKIAVACYVLTMFAVIEPLASRRTGAAMPLALAILFCGVSIVLLQARLANFSLLAAAAAAALGGVVIIAWINSNASIARGSLLVIGTLLGTLLALGWFYRAPDGVPLASFILLGASPFMLWLGELPFMKKFKPWQAALMRVGLVALPVLIAVGLALSATRETAAELGY